MGTRIDWSRQLGRRLKLRDLHVFMTVVQCGTMAKAAAELGVSQPVISAVIADLEHAVGARLFDRSPQGVEPTQFGQSLLKGGVGAFDELSQAIRQIEFLADPSAGEVRIGCPETVSAILPPIFQRIHQRHPRVVFHVSDIVAPTLDLPQLRDRSLDLAVLRIFWAPPHPEFLQVEEVFDDETLVVVGINSPWARRRKLDLAELVDEEWILPPAHTTNSIVVMDAFRARGLPLPQVSFVTFSVTLRTNLLATGRYVTVLPRSMMSLYARQMNLKVLPVGLAPRKWPVVLVTLKHRTLSPVAQLFIEQLRASAKGLDRKLAH
jgi:DNA-binding transcriptional LysR family regulator